jgi:hydroxymethylbilane synthase
MTRTNRPLRLGTRSSPLAMVQAHLVQDALIAAHAGLEIEIVPVVATGDLIVDRPLADVGGKALWTKELDAWLTAGDIDIAVHSMKDVETIRPREFVMAAMLERGDVRDRLVGSRTLNTLPEGARVGTSSPRRAAQLQRFRSDLKIVLFRGNVQTRLKKLADGEADATLLAAAGLERLGLKGVGLPVPVEVLLPAPAQGAIGIEARVDADDVRALVGAIDHLPTHQCVDAERLLLAELNGNCRSPVAALAQISGGKITLRAEVLSEDGTLYKSGASVFQIGNDIAPRELAYVMLHEAPDALRKLFGR